MKKKLLITISMIIAISVPPTNADNNVDSPLTKVQLSLAKKGNNYAGERKEDKASQAYQSAIDQAVSIDQCLALIKISDRFGSILTPVRRNCLTKAMHLAKNDSDYFQIVIAARQCQFYEITKEGIDALIARANTKDDLVNLAHQAQSLAVNDIAHTAMEKVYMLINSAAEDNNSTTQSTMRAKLEFAKQAKLMAMEDLMRKAIKDMLDEEPSAHGLCSLLAAVGPLDVPDLERKILHKAVYQVASINDCHEVYEAARRLGQQDIIDLAVFKGRKMLLMDQARTEQDAIKEQQEALRREQELKEIEATGQIPADAQSVEKSDNTSANNSEKKPSAPPGPGF